MSEHKFAEFRERAEHVVTPANPDRLLKRGRALRRRRHLAPVVAVAAIAAVGYGILTAGGDDGARTDDLPPVAPPSTPAPRWLEEDLPVAPGTYDLEIVMDDVPDATFEVFGDGWDAFSSGIYKSDTASAVSMGVGLYGDTPIDRCDAGSRAESLAGAVRQLTGLPGTVIAGPSPETVMGVTHLRLSLPVDVECPGGATPTPSNLLAIWDGSTDPTVTVDVWLIEHEDRLLILTKGVRGHPSKATLEELNQTMDSLRIQPRDGTTTSAQD